MLGVTVGGSHLMLRTTYTKECVPRATTHVRRMLRSVNAYTDLPSTHSILRASNAMQTP